jgi:hypothetical protein
VTSEIRLVVAAALGGAWLALFFLGHTAGGAIHALPAISLALLFWRSRGGIDRTEGDR